MLSAVTLFNFVFKAPVCHLRLYRSCVIQIYTIKQSHKIKLAALSFWAHLVYQS